MCHGPPGGRTTQPVQIARSSGAGASAATSASARSVHRRRSVETAWPSEARRCRGRVQQRPGRPQEEQVVALAVVGEPEVPHPRVGERQHGAYAVIRPRTSPNPIRSPPGPGAVAVMTTSSPSSRKPRVAAVGQGERLGAVPVSSISEPRWSGLRARDRAGGEQVAGAQRRAVDGHVGQLWAAVQYMAANGGRETTWPFSRTSSARSRPQAALGVVEVGQQPGVARRRRRAGVRRARRAARPRRDRGGERLAEERAERHVLPGLDVAGGPVVDQADAEDVVGRTRRARPGVPRGERRADDEADLGLDVEPRDGPEDGARRRGRVRWPLRARRPAVPDDDDRARAAVVADRQVLPVGGQRVVDVRPEDRADVPWRGARWRRSRRSRRRRTAAASARRRRGRSGDARAVRVVGEPGGDRRPDLGPDGGPGREQPSRVPSAKSPACGGQQRGRRGAEIEHVLADGDADPRRSRRW